MKKAKGFLITIIILLIVASLYAVIGWSGNIWPNSETFQVDGQDITVYYQIWKDGVTPGPGQGEGISAKLCYKLSSQSEYVEVEMPYFGDVGNNDEYSEVIPDDFFVENDIIHFYCEGYDSTDGTYSYGTDQNGAGPFTSENPGVYYIGSPTSQDVTVTFQVNMSLVSPVYDVSVAGTFNGWTPGEIILTDPDLDDIYTGDYTIPEGSNPNQEYKFINGTDWEYINNRSFIIDDSSPTQILPVVYFNDQNPEDYTSQDVTVTFNVDISDSASAGCIFDSLGIYGSIAPLDWDWGIINNPLAEITPDILWSGEVLFPTGSWKYVDFKFGRNGMDIEAGFGENHSFTIDDSSPNQTINCEYGVMGPVIEGFDISGVIGYYDGIAPVPNADVNITGDAAYTETTDDIGEYLFEDIPAGDYESTSFKDTDLGGLSGMDASRIARFSASLYSFDCMQWIASDVSLNGSTSGLDASRVARYAAGLIDALNPEDIEWVFTLEMITECPDWEPIVYENTYYYAPLESDMIDQDFFGIRLGDVSGNWVPDAQGRFPESSSETTEIDAGVNSTLRIPIIVDKVSAIEGVDISIAFDSEVLRLNGLTLNDGILADHDYAVESNFKEGKIVIYAEKELVSESGIVAFIEFDVIGVEGSSSEVYFTKFDVNETKAYGGLQVVDSEGNETVTRRIEATVVEPIPEKFTFYPNYPNPFNSKTVIKYDLPKDTYVNLQIYNIRGQLVKELVNGVESAGRKKIEWDTEGMGSGIYFYKIETQEYSSIKKMIKL